MCFSDDLFVRKYVQLCKQCEMYNIQTDWSKVKLTQKKNNMFVIQSLFVFYISTVVTRNKCFIYLSTTHLLNRRPFSFLNYMNSFVFSSSTGRSFFIPHQLFIHSLFVYRNSLTPPHTHHYPDNMLFVKNNSSVRFQLQSWPKEDGGETDSDM